MKRIAKWLILATASTSAWAGTTETTFVGFKAYEVFSLKAENGSEIKIGEGQLSPRRTPLPKDDWQAIGKAIGARGDQKLCKHKPIEDMNFEELMAYLDAKGAITSLHIKLLGSKEVTLSQEDKRVVSTIPLCKEFAETITSIGNALGLTSEPIPFPEDKINFDQENFAGTMVTGMGFANEGNGWLIVNNRLSTGQTAIAHLGIKYRDFQSLMRSYEKEIAFKYTKQPVALRFKQLNVKKKVTEGIERTERCTKTIYIQECTKDPQTGRGKCQDVPYDVEGYETNRTDTVEETFTNLIEYTTPDFSKVLGVAQLATKTTYEDREWGACEVNEPTPYPPRPF